MATIAEIGGTVRFEEAAKGSLMNLIVTASDGETCTYAVPHTGLQVKDGEVIEKGTQLTYGALNPHEVLRIRGIRRCVQLPHSGSSARVPSAGR